MKNFIKIFFLFTFSLQTLYAQDSVQNALNYYPLQTGNYWEYAAWNMQQNMRYDTTFFSIEVIGDSLLPNDKYYKILKKSIIPSGEHAYSLLERVDTLTANVYRYSEDSDVPNNEFLIDSLLSNHLDSSNANRFDSYAEHSLTTCEQIYDSEILSFSTRIKAFWNQSYMPGLSYKLAKDIGYIGDSQWEGTHWGTDIIYARINDLEIGSPLTIINKGISTPSAFKLYHAYPNPFNSFVTIEFYSPRQQSIEIYIYNIEARLVKKLKMNYCGSGLNSIRLNLNYLSSGIYFYKLKTKTHVFTEKLTYIK